LSERCQLPPATSTDIARELLGRTVYPQLFRALLGVEGAAAGRGVGRELLEVEPADGPGIPRIAGKKRALDGLRQVDEAEHGPVEVGEVRRQEALLLGGELFDRVAHGWAIVTRAWDASRRSDSRKTHAFQIFSHEP